MVKFSADFEFLFYNLDQIAYTFTKPGVFGIVNENMAEFCGCSTADLEGSNLESIIEIGRAAEIKDLQKNLFINGQAEKSRLEIELLEEIRTVEIETIPHVNEQGKVDFLLCLADDITKKLEQDKQLYRNKRRYRSIFNQAPLAFVVSDQQTRIIDWNQKAEEIFGWQKNEVIGQNYNLIIPENLYGELTDFMESVLDGADSYHINRNLTKSGQEIYCEWNSAVIRDRDNNIIEIISIANDITGKLAAERKIENQEEELKYSELRTQFFANISHELKTPLNLIFSSLQLFSFHLKSGNPAAKTDKFYSYLASIKNNGYRLLRLVNNLIDITKIDVDSFKLHLANFDIVKLSCSVAHLVRDYMQQKQRNFRFETEVEAKIIACDPFNIERVILNLLSNAVKFSDQGDEILFKVKEEKNWIVLTFRDTGMGIRNENKEIIFEQFRQVDQSFHKKREGSGIGLALAKSIIEMHAGKIEVESIFGIYTKFSVYLPKVKLDQPKSGQKSYSPDNLLNKIELEFSDIYNL